ncbi:hypothetical protein UlMin_025237 [Ulmus minor]
MNNPMSSDEDDGASPQSLGGFRYGIGVSVAVLSLILMVTLISYYCTRSRITSDSGGSNGTATSMVITTGEASEERGGGGLDDATLGSFPKLLYAQAKLHKASGESNVSSCSICLADYKDEETLRLLPDCGHLFHLGCVDPWLRHRPTCPICRTSPLPTPLTTPLAEVTPLTAAGRN